MKHFSLLLWGSLMLLLFACSSEEVPQISQVNSSSTASTQDREFVTLKSGVVVEKKGDKYFLGDIYFSESQLERLDKTGTFFCDPKEQEAFKPSDSIIVSPHLGIIAVYPINQATHTKSVGRHPGEQMTWAMVRFTWGKDLDFNDKCTAVDAINYIQSVTNVRFYNATGQPTSGYGIDFPYIEFITNRDDPFISWSACGRIGGKQNLAIGSLCGTMTVVHELCHAVGMYHEHQRIDRDNYITVNLNNVAPGNRVQFDKIPIYTMSTEFDWKSIMLYDSYTLSSNGLPTMLRKSDGQTFDRNIYELSNLDKMWINNFYVPYIARSDTYAELDEIVYKPDNTIMTPEERLEYQAYLNNGDRYPPAGGRIPNVISYND